LSEVYQKEKSQCTTKGEKKFIGELYCQVGPKAFVKNKKLWAGGDPSRLERDPVDNITIAREKTQEEYSNELFGGAPLRLLPKN